MPSPASAPECCDARPPYWVTSSRGQELSCPAKFSCVDFNPYAQISGTLKPMCISNSVVPQGWVVVSYPPGQPAGCSDATNPKVAAAMIRKIDGLQSGDRLFPLKVCDTTYLYGTFDGFNVGDKFYDSECNNGDNAALNAFLIKR